MIKKNKFEYLIWIIFSCIGLFIVILGLILFFTVFNIPNKVETKGIITKIYTSNDRNGNHSHDVYISYNVNGKEYESRINGYSSTFYEGKELNIYYDQKNPHKIGVKSLDLLFLIFPGIGAIFLIIGGVGILIIIKKHNLAKKLKANGKLIYATYVEAILNISLTVNGRHPYNIICEWHNPEDNKKYIFKSSNIWINPEIIITDKNITTIPVYVNTQNLKQYYVDTTSITEEIVDLS